MTGPRVATEHGTVEGDTVLAPGGVPVHRFLGVPYATAPDGVRRWSRPLPPAAWPGVRPARSFGAAAPQLDSLPSTLPSFVAPVTSEDCLTLNVWTPGFDGARPVMVWIHGGAYISGGSSQPVYDAARFAAEQDVVVVTVNYRLGALGFLCLEDAAPGGDVVANAGLYDQLAALRWARGHADAVGGDPSSITVFGESAGAGSILHLVAASPRPCPFDRAIAQSGEPRTLTRDQAATVAEAFARAVGVERADAAQLRDVPVDAILAAQGRAALELFSAIGATPFAPVVDGALVDVDVPEGFAAGRGADIGLVLGTTRDELRLFPDPASPTLDEERLARRLTRQVPAADPATVTAAYRARLGGDATAGDIWEAVRTDAMLRIPNVRLAEARAAVAAPTFVYRFDWAAPTVGAAHAVDLPFTFGTFDREGWGDAVGYDADADPLGGRVRGAWARFARGGGPDSGAGPDWPAYVPPRRATMIFDRVDRVDDDPDRETRTLYA